MALAIPDREAWLYQAADLLWLGPLAHIGGDKPPYRLAIGWPPGSRPGSHKMGACMKRAHSGDGHNEIWISPMLEDPVQIMAVLIHELIHAVDDCRSGHRGAFRDMALRSGLTGPMSATQPTPGLVSTLKRFANALGPLPHAAVDGSKRRRQSTRMLKVECASCGFLFRASRKQIDRLHPDMAACPCCNRSGVLRIDD